MSAPANQPVDSAAATSSRAWFIVTQVKANRIVYFTDDPDYQPCVAGDWYYVSHFVGDMPPEITLRNCWGWRFNGGVFSDVREPSKEKALDTLLEANKKALLKLLHQKVDRVRAPLEAASLYGQAVRGAKLDEARRYLALLEGAQAPDPEGFALLLQTATVRGLSLAETARLVVGRAREATAVLLQSEGPREAYAAAIRKATSQDELHALRERLMTEAFPEVSQQFPYPAPPMTPEDWIKPLTDEARRHEIGRLHARLRQVVNGARASIHRGYVEGEALVRVKAKASQAVLSGRSAELPPDDLALLTAFATARNLALTDAARLVMAGVAEADQVLRATEALKDKLTASIEGMRSLRDIQRVDRELDYAERSYLQS